MSRLTTAAPVAVILACVALLHPLQRELGREADDAAEEMLYLADGAAVKRLALGYDSLLADLYWMRAIQYFGAKAIDIREAKETGTVEMRLLYPLLDVTTTLDPKYIPPYRLGAYFLFHAEEQERAFELLRKGIRNNPNNVRLYQDLAFFEWNAGNCDEAARLYIEGAKLPHAPRWLASMSAVVLAECGKRDFAVQMLRGMLESTDNPRMRADFERRLLGYQALDEIDFMHEAIAFYEERTGRYPSSLRELTKTVRLTDRGDVPKLRLDRTGTPLDPTGTPYVYDAATGKVTTERLYLPEPIVIKTARKSE